MNTKPPTVVKPKKKKAKAKTAAKRFNLPPAKISRNLVPSNLEQVQNLRKKIKTPPKRRG